MLGSLVENNVSMHTNCAEHVLNQLDYLNNFELIDSDEMINEEYNIQDKFIFDIMNDKNLFINKYIILQEKTSKY